jgi:hypothetical protein
VNRHHLQAFLWLRWRLLINQLRRGGAANAVILTLLAAGAVALGAALFVGFFLLGLFVLRDASAGAHLYVWDGLIVAFLFSWTTGLFVDLQRSEVLSLEKFLHLPVSLKGAFLVNYLSSLVSLSLTVFLPGMVALGLALVIARGPALLLVLPLLAAFLLMVTAVTYQFQGWLASLMANKRRRRTVIVVAVTAFILTCQLPNLFNLLVLQPWISSQRDELVQSHMSPIVDTQYERRHVLVSTSAVLGLMQRDGRPWNALVSVAAAETTTRKYVDTQSGNRARAKELNRQTLQQAERTARLLNLLLPPGWLPLGAMALAEGDVLPALLGTLGLTLIGTLSLWRSYRTTVRLYQGDFSAGKRAPAAAPPPAQAGKPSVRLLEKHLPWLSEQASAIALGGFRSLTRAPEAKMMLLTPIILVLVFGSMVLTRRTDTQEQAVVPPLLAFGAMATILFSMIQLVGNQFGFDRSGFRVFVLSAAPRRDILLGKNLAAAPLAFGLGAVMLALVQAIYRMRLDYFLAALPQSVSMYLLFCLLANWLSIFAPMPVASGAFKPANPKGIPLLLHLVFVFLFPLALVPTLLPLGAEFVLARLGWVQGAPICLVLSLVECVAVVYLYRLVLTWQGDVLHAREQRILEIVTTKAE